MAPALSEVTREGGSRKIDVTCNVRDRDLGSVARDIEARLGQLSFGGGYHAEVLGEYALRQDRRGGCWRCPRLTSSPSSPAADRLRRRPAGAPGLRHVALRAGRRHWRRVFLDRGAVAGIARGADHGHRHRRAQRHHDGQPFPASRGRGGRAFRPRSRDSRRRGAARAHPDDRARDGACPAADCVRRRQGRSGDRAPAGGRHPRRSRDVDDPQPVPAAAVVSRYRAGAEVRIREVPAPNPSVIAAESPTASRARTRA